MLTKKEVALVGKIIALNHLTTHFIRKVYVEIPLLHFLQRHPKVKFFMTNFPYDDSQADSPLKDAFAKRNVDDTTIMFDADDPLMRIEKGKRVTAYQPEHFMNRIYIFGASHCFGINVSFDKTIASYLQKMLNESNLPYRVENEGQCYVSPYQDIIYNLNKLNPDPGDIIFISIDNIISEYLPFLDLKHAFDPPHDYRELFDKNGHINELGYEILSEKYFKFLTENNFFRYREFIYPPPVNQFTATVYHRNSRRVA